MIVGTVCLSHSPLMDKRRASEDVEQRFNAAVRTASGFVADADPDLTVLFFPDHLNGFFYNLLPCFCVGVQAESIGDYGTAPGELDIPQSAAIDCAASCIKAGVDVAISYDMKVDHGAVQPIELLSAVTPLVRVLPIFINCIAEPRPSFVRARSLGRAVGDWAHARTEKILIVGSGGLSHDPFIPTVETASSETKARLINGTRLTHAERIKRQSRNQQDGYGDTGNRKRRINSEWDRNILDAFTRGEIDVLDAADDATITSTAGSGAHELRAWVAALSAAQVVRTGNSEVLFYQPVEEWITGMGILTASPGSRAT